jgi:hypothetical protein
MGIFRERTCRRYLQGSEGVFCANFWSQRGRFAPCQGVWCPPCLKPVGRTEFPIALQYDDEGELITSEDEEKRFLEARAGDHLMTPFQCDQCHFRNIYQRDPLPGDFQDEEAIEFIRQAVIDSFWSREPSTVKSNLYEARRGKRSAKRFGFPEGSATPPLGPFPLSDDVGMKAAMVELDRSLDPGKYSDYVQWETFRKAQMLAKLEPRVCRMSLEPTSKVPTHTFWFHRFMVGIHTRVGGIRRQDEALSIDVLHAVDS